MRALTIVVLALAGCAAPIRMPERIEIPVAVGCLRELPAKPGMRTPAELAALDDYELPIALQQDRLARQQYERMLEAALQGCILQEKR